MNDLANPQSLFLNHARGHAMDYLAERVEGYPHLGDLDDLPDELAVEALEWGMEQAGGEDAVLYLFGDDDVEGVRDFYALWSTILLRLKDSTSQLLRALHRDVIPSFNYWTPRQKAYLFDCVRQIMEAIHEDMTTDVLGPAGRLPEDTSSVHDIGVHIGDHPYHLSEIVDPKTTADLFVPNAVETDREKAVEDFMDEVWKEVDLRLGDPVGMYQLNRSARVAFRIATPRALQRLASLMEAIPDTSDARMVAMALKGLLGAIAEAKDDEGYLDGEND